MKNVFIIISIILLSISCDESKTEYIEVVKIDSLISKKCFFFESKNSDTLKFVRNIEILENTIDDTLLLGNAILAPRYLGEFEYIQFEDKDDIILDLQYTNPPSDRICIHPYNDKTPEGVLKFKLKSQE